MVVAFGFHARREWKPFLYPSETARGCVMLPSKTFFIGSDKGVIYQKDLDTKHEATHRCANDRAPIQVMGGSAELLLARNIRSSLLFNVSTMAVIRQFSWENMTMFEGVMGGLYLRLSSDHLLSIYDARKDQQIVHRVQLPATSMIVSGMIVDRMLFLLSINGQFTTIDFRKTGIHESHYTMATEEEIPFSMDIIHGKTPIQFRIAIISSSTAHIMDLDSLSMKMTNRTIVRSASLCKVKWIGTETLVFLRSRHLELYSLETQTRKAILFPSGDLVSSMCYHSPFLLMDGGQGLWIYKMKTNT